MLSSSPSSKQQLEEADPVLRSSLSTDSSPTRGHGEHSGCNQPGRVVGRASKSIPSKRAREREGAGSDTQGQDNLEDLHFGNQAKPPNCGLIEVTKTTFMSLTEKVYREKNGLDALAMKVSNSFDVEACKKKLEDQLPKTREELRYLLGTQNKGLEERLMQHCDEVVAATATLTKKKHWLKKKPVLSYKKSTYTSKRTGKKMESFSIKCSLPCSLATQTYENQACTYHLLLRRPEQPPDDAWVMVTRKSNFNHSCITNALLLDNSSVAVPPSQTASSSGTSHATSSKVSNKIYKQQLAAALTTPSPGHDMDQSTNDSLCVKRQKITESSPAGAHLGLDLKWRREVVGVVRGFTERTPGTYIENKECSLYWHFQDTDPDFGLHQAKQMQIHFEQRLHSPDVRILMFPAHKYVVVQPTRVNKCRTLSHVLMDEGSESAMEQHPFDKLLMFIQAEVLEKRNILSLASICKKYHCLMAEHHQRVGLPALKKINSARVRHKIEAHFGHEILITLRSKAGLSYKVYAATLPLDDLANKLLDAQEHIDKLQDLQNQKST